MQISDFIHPEDLEAIKDMDLKKAIKEAKESYKEAKANGDIKNAINNRKCPVCGAHIEPSQSFCTECGTKLK